MTNDDKLTRARAAAARRQAKRRARLKTEAAAPVSVAVAVEPRRRPSSPARRYETCEHCRRRVDVTDPTTEDVRQHQLAACAEDYW